MRCRSVHPMAGDADRAYEAFVSRLQRSLERTARARGATEVLDVANRVELDEVDVLDLQPLERTTDRVVRPRHGTVAGLGRQEDLTADPRHPDAESHLGLAVRRRGVEVVDAGVERLADRGVGDLLRDVADRRPAEDENAAQVTDTPEPSPFHELSLLNRPNAIDPLPAADHRSEVGR